MFDPFNYRQIMKYLTWTFILIVFLIMSGIAVATEYTKINPIHPDEVNGQFCYIKVTIKQRGDEVVKEEILECVMVESVLMVLVIGNYLLSFITMM